MDGGGDTASYDDVGGGDNNPAVEEDDGGEAPPPVMSSVAVFLAIRRRRPPRPRVTRPNRRRAVVPGAVGCDHGVRRTKEFQQWREWYLRTKRREREVWYHIGMPPPA
ncbi:unnamed protein product [Urochloa decumbens]|uniref:Uncharacterized protein n=1 Tax=Urochloa decumbens TaxID=240449 RepID=A0ABC9DVW1_9POAL